MLTTIEKFGNKFDEYNLKCNTKTEIRETLLKNLENVMKNGIDRVEILKGNQSSLYGSNAIGGTINIFTKQGREGRNSNYQVETGSNNTQNFSYSMDGTEDKFSYFVGLNKFITDGVSAMNDNSEQDGYENQNIVGNLGYKINENFEKIAPGGYPNLANRGPAPPFRSQLTGGNTFWTSSGD